MNYLTASNFAGFFIAVFSIYQQKLIFATKK